MKETCHAALRQCLPYKDGERIVKADRLTDVGGGSLFLRALIAVPDDYVFELPLRNIEDALFVKPVLCIVSLHLDGF